MRFGFLIFGSLFLLSPTAQAGQEAKPNPPTIVHLKDTSTNDPFFILKPNNTLEATLFRVCKLVTNHDKKALAFIPIAANTWPNFESRKDQNGTLAIEVKPCD